MICGGNVFNLLSSEFSDLHKTNVMQSFLVFHWFAFNLFGTTNTFFTAPNSMYVAESAIISEHSRLPVAVFV